MTGQTKPVKYEKTRDISHVFDISSDNKILRGGNKSKATKTGRAR